MSDSEYSTPALLGVRVDWKCVRCGCTESMRWSICIADDGTTQAFCLDCHRAGYEGGFSYIGDEVFTPNNSITVG